MAQRKTRKAPAKKGAAPRKTLVKPIPEGYHAITPYLCVDGASKAIDWYKKALGARERMRMDMPGGKIGHAELQFGDSVVMLADEYAEMDFLSPGKRGGTPVTIHFYVRKVDAAVERAVAEGAKVLRPLKDEFYGDRNCTLQDPFGHVWHLSQHVRDVSMKEMRAAMKALAG